MIELRAFQAKNGERSALGQGIARYPWSSDITCWAVSVSAKVLASSTPRKEEKRKASPQTGCSAAGEWTRLPVLFRGQGQADSSEAQNARILAVTEREGRAEEESRDGRILLVDSVNLLMNTILFATIIGSW